ncbi:MAG TPA: IclR family transcriptional regulator [Segeticoccus sp.]|uniref:IclR family transcriptional regulator n=1 Tax=Segeticoccus sp. TaxID=2706531 RepID=UPI002D7F2778|nr:IclR family transcriptional regulator [Segeticoccus sp.]HET8599525.1 IclR family transcriptional regulator [Segeticoccus sp.]
MGTSVVRAMRILELLAQSEKPLPLARVTEALQIPKSTAHSILASLVQEGFVQVHEPASYAIGLKAFEVGAAHLRATGTVGVVAPELARLTRTLNITSHWAVLEGHDAVYLCKEDPPGRGVQLASSIGARLPARVTAVGKSCLAWLEPEVAATHVDLPPQGDPTRDAALTQVNAELEHVRANGFSTDNGEAAVGITCVAAPVFDMSGPRGAIGVSFLRGTGAPFDTIVAEVKESASRATSLLGGRGTR